MTRSNHNAALAFGNFGFSTVHKKSRPQRAGFVLLFKISVGEV